MTPEPSQSAKSASPGAATPKRTSTDAPRKAAATAAKIPARPAATVQSQPPPRKTSPALGKAVPAPLPQTKKGPRDAGANLPTRPVAASSDHKRAMPEPKKAEVPLPPGAVVVYLAVRVNDDVKVDVPGRDFRVKTAPGGWRAALFLDTGEGVEAMNRVGGDKIPTEQNSSNELAATSFGILKAIEFVHDQRPDVSTIILRMHHDNALEAENNRAHPSSRYNWVARQNLEKWGMRIEVQVIKRTENKATTVLAKTEMPNYWTGISKANPQATPPGAPRQSAVVAASSGWDGRAALVDASMSAEEIRARIGVVEEQLAIARAILAVKEPGESAGQKM